MKKRKEADMKGVCCVGEVFVQTFGCAVLESEEESQRRSIYRKSKELMSRSENRQFVVGDRDDSLHVATRDRNCREEAVYRQRLGSSSRMVDKGLVT